MREIARRHRQPIIDRPQRGPEARADAREAPTRGRVRLEHDERLARGDRELRRVQVLRDHVHRERVREEGREFGLRVFGVPEAFVDGCAVVVGVAEGERGGVSA